MKRPPIPLRPLPERAELAAADFMLPAVWWEGRERHAAVAIDGPYTMSEDALAAVENEDESDGILCVSSPDLGSFLYDQPDILAHARQRIRTLIIEADGKKEVSQLLPRRIRRIFQLYTNDRPALTMHIPVDTQGKITVPHLTRDVLRVEKITFQSVDEQLQEAGNPALNGLARITQRLHVARMGQARPPMTAQDVVSESMMAGAHGMGLFMQAHAIPGLHRNIAAPLDIAPHIVDPLQRRKLLIAFATRGWSTEAIGAWSQRLPTYAPWNSPLREFADLANQCNATAFLDGRPFPFPKDVLQEIATRMTKHEKALADRKLIRDEYRTWDIGPFDATALARLLERPGVRLRHLVVALFEASGTEKNLRRARQSAAQYIAKNPHLATRVITLAVARNNLYAPDDTAGRTELYDTAGNVYNRGALSASDRLHEDVAFIGRVAGLKNLKPRLPEPPAPHSPTKTRTRRANNA